MILEMENQPLSAGTGLAARIAERALAKRGAAYADEVRRLLDAGLAEMERRGTGSRPRVADIVAAAGLSNDAFYRHFPSKDALVAAIVEDGADRLRSYLEHQMAKEPTAERKVRRWVEGVLAQAADPKLAASTRAVLWNAGSGGNGLAAGHPSMNEPLASLLVAPFAELGSADPELDVSLVAHAVIGRLSDHLQEDTRPSKAVIARVVSFALSAARP
jgi:AcrR family transcriptional regulator